MLEACYRWCFSISSSNQSWRWVRGPRARLERVFLGFSKTKKATVSEKSSRWLSKMWSACRKPRIKSLNSSISSNFLKNITNWAQGYPKGLCWLDLQVQGRPWLPRHALVRVKFLSLRSAAVSLSKCTWAWVPKECVTYSSRPNKMLLRLYSSTKSTQSAKRDVILGLFSWNGRRWQRWKRYHSQSITRRNGRIRHWNKCYRVCSYKSKRSLGSRTD